MTVNVKTNSKEQGPMNDANYAGSLQNLGTVSKKRASKIGLIKD